MRNLGFPLPIADSYAAAVEPMFMGAVTPGRIGEFSRVAFLARHEVPVASAVALSIVERATDLCALVCVSVGGVLYLFGPAHLRQYAFLLIVLLFWLLALSCRASYLAIPRLQRLAAGSLRSLGLPGENAQRKLWAAIRQTIRGSATFIAALAIACTLLNLCQIYMLSLAFGFPASRIPICFAFAASAIMALLPIAPAGLGTREATYIFVMARQGIGREQALLFSLLDGVVFAALCPLLMAVPLWIRSVLRRVSPGGSANGPTVSVSALSLVRRSIRKRGWRATAAYIIAEISFDWRFGTETRAPVAAKDLGVSVASQAHAIPYLGTNWFLLKRIFSSLIAKGRIDPRKTCLVDFGCGKGRVLLAALHFGIGKVIGIEFSPRLCAGARDNLSRNAGMKPGGQPSCWEVIEGDVLDFRIPEEANMFFLYNPFVGPVLEEVAARIRRACEISRHQCVIVYVNPVEESVFRHLGFAPADGSDDEVAIYVTAPSRVQM
jgi:uncharacterized protein (TIRG00374 family)